MMPAAIRQMPADAYESADAAAMMLPLLAAVAPLLLPDVI